jgi:hypothetical protein
MSDGHLGGEGYLEYGRRNAMAVISGDHQHLVTESAVTEITRSTTNIIICTLIPT